SEPPCRYLPSKRTQSARQARLPDPATLGALMQMATQGLPFRADAFAPFLRDVEAAGNARALAAEDLVDSALAPRLASLLPDSDPPVALIGLTGVHDPDALRDFAKAAGTDL